MAFETSMNELFAPIRMKMDIAHERRTQEKFYADQARLRAEAENKQNNQMIDMFWKAATDEGTPRALFENIQGMAKELTQTMTPQQRASFSAVVARGFFSKHERLSDEYQRIKGPRPQVNFESITGENIQQYAEAKVSQVEYDYGHRAYLAGGKDKLGEDAIPGLVPAGSFMDKDDKRHDIYAFKNPATGLVGTIDTQTDIPGDMLNAAKKQGFGPTMMAQWNFIPFKGETSRLVTMGDTQYMMHTGVKLSTGEPHSIKIPVGPATEASQTRPIQPPSQALDIVNWMENGTAGGLDAEDAGKYQGWVKQAQALEDIPIPKGEFETFKAPDGSTVEGMPKLGTMYATEMIRVQRKFQLSHPGWAVAPTRIGHREAGGIWPMEMFVDNYYAENAEWNLFPSDGERALLRDGKPNVYHYKERLGEERHVWFDHYGRRLYDYTGKVPGTEVGK